MKYKRIYFGTAGIVTIISLFIVLQSIGLQITSDGNKVCAGTIKEPCMSLITIYNPTARNIYIYNRAEIQLDFSPEIKEYFFFTEDKRCSATGKCVCIAEDGRKVGFKGWRCTDFTNATKPRKDRKYVFMWARYSTRQHLLVGYKYDPYETIKWGFGMEEDYLDPNWGGIGTVTIFMDEQNKNWSYEFGSVANISAGYSGSAEICIDLSAPNYGVNYSCATGHTSFLYNITLLRNNIWNETKAVTTNKTSKEQIYFNPDNRTELIQIDFNITSNCTIEQIEIIGSGWGKKYEGRYKGNYLNSTDFVYSGNYYNATNISFTQKGSKNIYLNITGRPLNLIFYLTGFDIDVGNDLDFTEDFNGSDYINISTANGKIEVIGEYDNFESNATNRWTEEATHPGLTTSRLSTGNTDDYYQYDFDHCSSDQQVYTYYLINEDDTNFNLQNLSYLNIEKYAQLGGSGGDAPAMFTVKTHVYVTDGTNSVTMYSFERENEGCSASNYETKFENITFKKKDATHYRVYINDVYSSTADLSSLDATTRWYLKFYIWSRSLTLGKSCYLVNYNKIYRIETSGLWLNKTQYGSEFNTSGTITSNVIANTSVDNNYTGVHLYAEHYLADNITYEFSADDGINWKDATNFVNVQKMLFDTQGNRLKYRINLSGSNESSPIVYDFNIQVIPSATENVTIDFGDTGSDDFTYTGILNATTSPQIVNLSNMEGYNETYTTVKISVDTAGTLQIDNLFLNQTINPIELNTSYFEDCYDCFFNFTYSNDCSLLLSDLKWDYHGSKNYTVHAHSTAGGDNKTIHIYYSNFNLSFPSGIYWFDFFPSSNNAKNVSPYGQTDTHPIRNVTGLGYDRGFDLYIKTNDTFSRINFTFHNDSNQSTGTPILLNTSYQKICSNITAYNTTWFDSCGIWSWIDLYNHTGGFELPWFFYSAVCTDCYFNYSQLDYYNIIVD